MSPESHPSAVPPRRAGLNHLEDRDETTDVSAIHAAVLREKADPREGMEPVSLWLIALTGLLLFWGGYYLQRYSGGFKPLVYNENISGTAPPATGAAKAEATDAMVLGKRVFSTTCYVCHQTEGQGNPATQVPPLAGSDWVNASDPSKIIRFVLNGAKGPITVKGQAFPGTQTTMTPFRDVYTDAQIAAVLTYVRHSWGNKAPAVTPDEVKAIREKTKGRTEQWTVADVEKDVAAAGGAPTPGAAAAATASTNSPDQIEKLLKSLPADQLKQVLNAVAPQK
jgi:mono/diheme cytochrome c family protein